MKNIRTATASFTLFDAFKSIRMAAFAALALAALILALPFTAHAEVIQGDGWTFDKDTATLRITKNMIYWHDDVDPKIVRKIIVAKSCTRIYGTVMDCWNLVRVDYEGTLEDWFKISFECPPFALGADLYISGVKVVDLEIPEGITSVPFSAFEYCTSIKSVTFPASVTSVGDYAFTECSSLTDVSFAENAKCTSIGRMSFGKCKSLSSVVIPPSVTTIDLDAFASTSDNPPLKFVTVPDSVTSIGFNAFPAKTILRCTEDSYAAKWAEYCQRDRYCVTDDDHEMAEIEAEVQPTCSMTGKKAVAKCKHCSYRIGGETIPMLDHVPKVNKGHAATCTEPGLSDGVQCSICTVILKSQTITDPPLGHKHQIITDKAAKVGFPGLTTGVKCSRCGEVLEKQQVIAAKAPAPVKIASLKKSGTKATLKWEKSTSENATGYQIRYSVNKSMKKAKVVKVKSWKTYKKVIKKLKSSKRYYFQVRVYKNGKDTAGKAKTYYSKWSAKKRTK